MKKLFIYLLIFVVISTTFTSCVGYGGLSYGSGFQGACGPYGYGSSPRVNAGMYGGGIR